MSTEVRFLTVADESRFGLAALVVDVGIPQPAVLADMEVGAAVRTRVSTTYLHANLHVKDLLVAARPTEIRHGAAH